MFGEKGILAAVPTGSAAAIASRIRADSYWLAVIPAAASILVLFGTGDPSGARRRLRRELSDIALETKGSLKVIPVIYGGSSGPDLADVAKIWGVSTTEAVRLHTSAIHRVQFLGFMPGFPYMESGHVAVPRLSTPRLRVPAGSVAVAGTRTGIYPRESPGGWRIIGQTSEVLFDPSSTPPTLLMPGDSVLFVPVRSDKPHWKSSLRTPE